MQFEDLAGTLEAVLFASNYERLSEYLVDDKAVLAKATILPEEGGPPKLSIQDLVPLELAGVQYPSLIAIRVPLGRRAEAVDEFAALVQRKPGDTGIRLRLESPRDFALTVDLGQKVRPDREFKAEVAKLFGPDACEVLAG
jgi:DNA polymerase-3 subunit alpha